MHPFSILTLGIFVAGYITARWDLVTRLYELVIFAWDHGVVVCTSYSPVPLRLTNTGTTGSNRKRHSDSINLLLSIRNTHRKTSLEGDELGTTFHKFK